MQTSPLACISMDDYLSGELVSPVRHEYLDGQVHAMTSNSRNHFVFN